MKEQGPHDGRKVVYSCKDVTWDGHEDNRVFRQERGPLPVQDMGWCLDLPMRDQGPQTSHPRGQAEKKRGGNPEASPGSGECADPPDDLRLRDLGGVLLRSQSYYGTARIGGEEPI